MPDRIIVVDLEIQRTRLRSWRLTGQKRPNVFSLPPIVVLHLAVGDAAQSGHPVDHVQRGGPLGRFEDLRPVDECGHANAAFVDLSFLTPQRAIVA